MFLLTNIFKDYSNFRNVQEFIIEQIKSEGKDVDSYFFGETTDLGYPLPTINELKDVIKIMIVSAMIHKLLNRPHSRPLGLYSIATVD